MAEKRQSRRSAVQSALGYAVIAASVWLGWEALKIPFAERAPPGVALRLAPGSPEALRRAAEGELLSEDWDDAAFLARRSLAEAPFNARALRVLGLATARQGDLQKADHLLTLAGNWSLRDDPAHAWLVEHRLRQGSYASAFAHADTLARRRPDLHEQTFNLFTTAVVLDQRAFAPVIRLVAANPPWRSPYLNALQRRPDGDAVLLNLAVALQATSSPLSDRELSAIYQGWVRERRYEAVRVLRTRLARPPIRPAVQNGDFSQRYDGQLAPFGWSFATAAGLSVEITDDDLSEGNPALRVGYDGYGSTAVAQQLVLLEPGRYTLSARYRQENASSASLEWVVTCVEGGAPLLRLRLPEGAEAEVGKWANLSATVTVPETCTAQRLVLAPRAADRRSPLAVWFDDIGFTRLGAPGTD